MKIDRDREGEVVYDIFGRKGTILCYIEWTYYVKWNDEKIEMYSIDEYNNTFGCKELLRKCKIKKFFEDEDLE